MVHREVEHLGHLRGLPWLRSRLARSVHDTGHSGPALGLKLKKSSQYEREFFYKSET